MNPHIDNELLLEDGAAAITADGAGSNARDVGPGRVPFETMAILNVSALTTGGGETYLVYVEGSNDSHVTNTKIGCVEVIATGRYEIAFSNVQNSTNYRSVRLFYDVGAAGVPSITNKGWLAPPAQYR